MNERSKLSPYEKFKVNRMESNFTFKVGLPYHRPRQRTLDEFLNRKKGSLDLIDDMKKLPKYAWSVFLPI